VTAAGLVLGAALGFVAGAVLLARRRLLLVTVEGESMAPTYTAGDRVVVRRATLAGVRRGAVVVLAAPAGGAPGDPPLLVKRAVAVPGDPVPAGIPVPDRVVPPGRLVVLGDNAGRSADSRVVGFIPAADVVGVALRPAGLSSARHW
jgi:signal peptidase I